MAIEKKMDWNVLKAPLIVFSFSLVLSATLVAGTSYFRNEMEKSYNTEKKRFQTVSNQYLAVDQEEKQVKEYLPQFIQLYNRGLLGEERRLNWIESLRAASDRIKMLGLRYKIDSQVPYTPDYAINTGIYRLYSSSMTLNMDLLHMGDMQQLLDLLNSEVEGMYNINSCSFNRKGGEGEFKPEITANISAECELKWFNIKRSDGSVIEVESS